MSDRDLLERRERSEEDGALYPPDTPGQGVDRSGSAVIALAEEIPGAPLLPASVRSVWDTRPINARDFYIIRSREAGGPGSFAVGVAVPDTAVAVLRGVRYFMDPPPAAGGPRDYLLDVQVHGVVTGSSAAYPDGIAVPDYAAIPVGVATDGLLPLHLIVAPGGTFGARLTVNVALVGTWIMVVEFYGVFLLDDGRPPTFQIGNWEGRT